MPESLLVIHIGPVQDFIASARRSRDLWFGSLLLSELAKAAAAVLPHGSLISPHESVITNKALSAPNILIAKGSFDQAQLKQVQVTVRTRLQQLADAALGGIKDSQFDRKLADKQIADLLELYWVSLPMQEGDNGFVETRKRVNFYLSARKATRNFSPHIGGSSAFKSSLDGARESLIPHDAHPTEQDTAAAYDRKSKSLYHNYKARPGERLSGVDLLKRLGMPPEGAPKFNSTSHMAARPFIEQLDAEKTKTLVAAIRALPFLENAPGLDEADDGSLLYENRLSDFVDQLTPEDVKAYNKCFEDNNIKSRPGAYYALIAADGDGMGELIAAQDLEGHRALSRALSGFAGKARAIIENYKGVPIYVGGDDLLAYLPLRSKLAGEWTSVLECARQLRSAFEIQDAKGHKIKATLSAGLVVAHHLEPLSEVLKLAREAEKAAKRVDGKDSLAITLSKRSGVDRTIVGKWESLVGISSESEPGGDARLLKLVKYAQAGAISAGAAHELYNLSLELEGLPSTVISKEAARILRRKQDAEGDQPNPEAVQDLTTWLEQNDARKVAMEMIVARAFVLPESLDAELSEKVAA